MISLLLLQGGTGGGNAKLLQLIRGTVNCSTMLEKYI